MSILQCSPQLPWMLVLYRCSGQWKYRFSFTASLWLIETLCQKFQWAYSHFITSAHDHMVAFPSLTSLRKSSPNKLFRTDQPAWQKSAEHFNCCPLKVQSCSAMIRQPEMHLQRILMPLIHSLCNEKLSKLWPNLGNKTLQLTMETQLKYFPCTCF